MTFDVVIQKFDDYFTPKKNITYQRYRFFSYNQNDGQSIDSYATELRTRADHCDFGNLKDSLIRDKIVIGIRDSKTQKRLLTLSPTAFYDLLSYGGGIFIPHPRKQC